MTENAQVIYMYIHMYICTYNFVEWLRTINGTVNPPTMLIWINVLNNGLEYE